MRELNERRVRPELKQLVVEASRALAQLDADRLEELAQSCQALNRDLERSDRDARGVFAAEAIEARGDMAVFARVLEVTRANLNVMTRLRDLRMEQLEYGGRHANRWGETESKHGDN